MRLPVNKGDRPQKPGDKPICMLIYLKNMCFAYRSMHYYNTPGFYCQENSFCSPDGFLVSIVSKLIMILYCVAPADRLY